MMMTTLNLKTLLLSLSSLLALSCGPQLFTGAEIIMEIDGDPVEVTTDDEIEHNDYTSAAERRYTLDIQDEGFSLGWPSIEPGVYPADLIKIELDKEVNFNTEYYSLSRCRDWETRALSTLTVTSNDYGLIGGQFTGYVCSSCGYECEDRIKVEGSFAASLDEGWF